MSQKLDILHLKSQIEKDAELISTNAIDGATWHFYKSPITGKIGPSKPLLKNLNDNNIKVIIHR